MLRRNVVSVSAVLQYSITHHEFIVLMSNFATSNAATNRRGGTRKLPMVFTEHGALMAACVLNTPRAIQISVFVVRAFVRLREKLASNKELARKLDGFEKRTEALAL